MSNFGTVRFKIKKELKSFGLQRKLTNVLHSQKAPQSAIFYTIYKCASTFVEKLFDVILKNSSYEFVDYAGAVERMGDRFTLESPAELYLQNFLEQEYCDLYSRHGKIYGPQRFPLDFPGRVHFKHIFFLRDPRDVLVSDYFSQIYTHPEPRNTVSRNEFLSIKKAAQELGIDKYALKYAEEWILPLYDQYRQLRETSESHIYLKYDLFAENTPEFIKRISDYLELNPAIKDIEILTKEANPVQKTEIMKHKRSGKTGQYLEKLQSDTVEKLNRILSGTLADWEFTI